MSQLTDATPSDRHRLIAGRFARLIDGVQNWDAPSPVADWDAAGVVEHLGWLPGFLQHIAGVELQVADADSPAGRFAAQSDAVQAILDAPKASEIVETTMFGAMPLQHLIDQFYTADVFMHSWDLATASGQAPDLDEDFARNIYEGMRAMGPALHESGQFGTPQPVAEDGPVQDKLIALIGRDPSWTPQGR